MRVKINYAFNAIQRVLNALVLTQTIDRSVWLQMLFKYYFLVNETAWRHIISMRLMVSVRNVTKLDHRVSPTVTLTVMIEAKDTMGNQYRQHYVCLHVHKDIIQMWKAVFDSLEIHPVSAVVDPVLVIDPNVQ